MNLNEICIKMYYFGSYGQDWCCEKIYVRENKKYINKQTR